MLNSVYSQTQVNALDVALTWTLREQPFRGNSYGGRCGSILQDVVKTEPFKPNCELQGKKDQISLKTFTHLQIISCLEAIVDGTCIVDDLSDFKLHLL